MKSKMKKVLLTGLSLVLVAALAITGTIAYLQDDDSAVNVMTLGNVQIEQHEYQRATNEDGSYKTATVDDRTSYVLEAFEQGKPLLPIVGDPNEPGNSPAYAGWDTIPVRMSQVDSYGGMSVFAGKNAQDKFVTVENTGKTDAYVRTIVAIEVGSTDGALIGSSYQSNAWTRTFVDYIVIDENTYMVFEFNYPGAPLSDGTVRHENGVLPAGETTYPNLAQVYLKHNATNEDMVAIDGNKNGTLDILVLSQAVQTAGFADAQTALDTAFGKSSDKAAEWFGGIAENAYINEALSQNYDATQKVVIDGKGKEVFSYIDEELINWGEAGNKPNYANVFTNATVSNISFTGTMMPVMSGYWDGNCNFNNTFNNVNLVGVESVGNAAGFSAAMIIYGDATLNNCNIYGTTTEKEGTKLYDAMTQIGHTTINGGKVGNFYMANAGTTLTVNGAEMDSIYAAGRKAMIINIGEGSVIGTITLPKQATLTIAEGAIVNTIICNGVTYTQAEWMAR